jgi:hypothetical protein
MAHVALTTRLTAIAKSVPPATSPSARKRSEAAKLV